MTFIKNTYRFLYTAALFLGLGLSSCIYDDMDAVMDNGKVLGPGSYYIAVDVDVDRGLGTRADEDGSLVDGSDELDEHSIGADGNFILFFDDNKRLTEVLELHSTKTHPEIENVEARFFAKIDVDVDYKVPPYAMAILNAGTYASTLKAGAKTGMTPEEITALTWEAPDAPLSIGRDGKLFTMTTNRYVSNGEVFNLVDVPEDLVQDATLPDDPSKVLTLRVERMVAKFTLEFGRTNLSNGMSNLKEEDGVIIYTNEREQLLFTKFDEDGIHDYSKEIDWQVKVTGWGMNAVETKSNLYRQIDPNGKYGFNWNDPGNYRSYWSVDPHYYHKDVTSEPQPYPWQYLQAVNNPNIPYYQEFIGKDKHVLRNFSYNQFIEANNLYNPVYTPENTYDYDDLAGKLDNRTDVLAGTHLIIAAELMTDLENGKGMTNNTVFRDRTRILYENIYDVFRSQVMSFNYDLGSQTQMKFVYYNWDDPRNDPNNGVTYVAIPSGGKYFLYLNGEKLEIGKVPKFMSPTNPDEYDLGSYCMKAEVQHGDGRILIYNEGLDIRDEKGNRLPIYDLNGKELVLSDADYRNIIKSMLMEWVGTTEHFIDGRMYYFYPAKITDSKCGTVRNAWYQYRLSGINSIGTSVTDPDDPIVPDQVLQNQQMINIEVHIIPWHIGLDTSIDILPDINY